MAAWTSAVIRVVCRYLAPPWTIRCPITSTGPGTERSACSIAPGLRSKCISHSGGGGAEGGSAWISSSRHLKLLEPPLIARIFIDCLGTRSLTVAPHGGDRGQTRTIYIKRGNVP